MTEINRLNRSASLEGSDLIPIWDSSDGATRSVSANVAGEFFSGAAAQIIQPLVDEATKAAESAAESAESAAGSVFGVREVQRRSYAEAGYTLVDGSFDDGGTISAATDVLLFELEGVAYQWLGARPKVVPPSSTPASTGGVGAGAWAVVSENAATTPSVHSLLSLPTGKPRVSVLSYHANTNLGGGDFRYDGTVPKSMHNGGTIISPTVPWDGTQATLAAFLAGAGESNPGDAGCWVRDHGYEVFVSWFGAVGDAARPTSSIPDGDVPGTDDTLAIGKCRDYLQTVAFQPNLFVGFWGGFDLCFEPNKCYKIVGHNPLGSTRPRNSDADPSGQMNRQSWRINGNGCLLVWEVSAENDCFIESHETFTTQYYSNFNVIVAKAVGKMGIFYSNDANPGRNATQRHKFDRVEVYHAMPNSPTHGLKYMFRYLGTNLGDRLITEQCAFGQAHTFFYSENSEAVQQGFKSTTFASYLDNATFFHLRSHGSGFSFSAGTGFLIKGNNQTWLRTEYLPGSETGSNGGHTYMDVKGCRFEFSSGKVQTVANCDFGVLEINGMAMAPGGLPDVTSPSFIARKTAVIRVENSHVYGRAIVGQEPTNVVIKRSYAIKFDGCQFSNDIAKSLFVEDATGSLIPWRDAILGAYQVPAVVINGTDTRTATWQGLPVDSTNYVFDNVYPCNVEYNTIPVSRKLVVGRYRQSSKFFYLDNRNYVVLPPFIAITSIKISHSMISTAIADTIRVKVGSAFIDYAPPNNLAKRNLEILPAGQVMVVSDWDRAERTIGSEILLAGVPLASPSVIAHLEIEWRPAYGLLEMTATETGGVRLTRIA